MSNDHLTPPPRTRLSWPPVTARERMLYATHPTAMVRRLESEIAREKCGAIVAEVKRRRP